MSSKMSKITFHINSTKKAINVTQEHFARKVANEHFTSRKLSRLGWNKLQKTNINEYKWNEQTKSQKNNGKKILNNHSSF